MNIPDDIDPPPSRAEIDASTGPLVLEFGASWCGYCRAFEPHLERLRDDYPDIPVRRIEDGPGQRLGRSFGVKLWPNLVFLRDGQVVRQLARPTPAEAREAFEALRADAS